MRRTSIKLTVLACCVLAALFVLCGCVFSETITERIYDNNPESTVDPSLDPILINSADAQQTSDQLPKLANDDTNRQDDTQEDMSQPEPGSDEPAPTTQYNASANANGVVSGQSTQTQTSQGDEGEPDDSDEEETPQEPDEPDPGTEDDDNDDDNEDDDNPDEGRQSGGSGDYYSDTPDYDDPEIPENIDEVVAFGNNAVIVSMIGGNADKSALLGCDASTKNKTSKVLAERGMKTTQALDCVEGELMPDAAFEQLANTIKPDMVYVTEGKNPFTEEQLATLSANHISVYTLPALTSDTRIRFTVQIVARTLAEGGVAGAQERCDAYLDFCNNLVDDYQGKNGGITGGFDFEEGYDVDTSASTLMTLFIDRWNEDARFSDPYGYLDTSSGVALATLGYGTSPTNYFLSVGGVLNNAANAKIRTYNTQGTGIVWQFAPNVLSFGLDRWKPKNAASFDLSVAISGSLFSSCLLCYMTDQPNGLGSELFPAVIVKNQRIGSLLAQNSSRATQLYYPYPTINPAGHGRTVGYFVDSSESTYIESCIGRDGGDSSILNGNPYVMYVNPKGLCQGDAGDTLCSWTDGSLESVLEASWAYYRFRGGDQATFRQDVSNFYSTVYGYSPSTSDLDAIEAGAAS